MIENHASVIWKDQFSVHSPEDSDLWLDLVMYASVMDTDFAAILIYLRNAGTRLVDNDKYGYKLVPVVGDNGWQSMEQYKKESQYLKPYKTQLVFCLKKLQKDNEQKSP